MRRGNFYGIEAPRWVAAGRVHRKGRSGHNQKVCHATIVRVIECPPLPLHAKRRSKHPPEHPSSHLMSIQVSDLRATNTRSGPGEHKHTRAHTHAHTSRSRSTHMLSKPSWSCMRSHEPFCPWGMRAIPSTIEGVLMRPIGENTESWGCGVDGHVSNRDWDAATASSAPHQPPRFPGECRGTVSLQRHRHAGQHAVSMKPAIHTNKQLCPRTNLHCSPHE